MSYNSADFNNDLLLDIFSTDMSMAAGVNRNSALQQNLWVDIVTVLLQIIDILMIIMARWGIFSKPQEFAGAWDMDEPVTKGSLSLRERELARWQPTNSAEEPEIIMIH